MLGTSTREVIGNPGVEIKMHKGQKRGVTGQVKTNKIKRGKLALKGEKKVNKGM